MRIHSKEYFKEKYAVDDVQYADEVSSSWLLSVQVRASVTPPFRHPLPLAAIAWLCVVGCHRLAASHLGSAHVCREQMGSVYLRPP